jgi:carbon monoxide dehydrogenase subunit G
MTTENSGISAAKDSRGSSRRLTFALVPGFDLTVEIARPPEDVFSYLTDVSNLPEWQSSASSAEADEPLREGSRIRERRRFMGRDVKTELEVTAYEPPRRFDVKSRGGPVSYGIHHALEPAATGTRLQVKVDAKIGGMMRFAAKGPLKAAEREFRADFERLKQILETE